MARTQPRQEKGPKRGLLARPLDALVFLIPLLVFCEFASFAWPDRVIAFDLLRKFFELFGRAGMWAPGLGVIVILLATHAASGERWSIQWKRVGLMYVEAAVLSVPLLAFNWAITPGSLSDSDPSVLRDLAFGVGAGIYEELVFRLILISVAMMIGVDLLGFRRSSVALAAILGSSLLFAAHHHQPLGAEAFDPTRFVFRAVAGGYLALIFWYRGYGPAAGCHAAYNAGLIVARVFGG